MEPNGGEHPGLPVSGQILSLALRQRQITHSQKLSSRVNLPMHDFTSAFLAQMVFCTNEQKVSWLCEL